MEKQLPRVPYNWRSYDMKDLDGLIVNFTADMEGVNQNATLNKGMTLKLSNIRIRIKDGGTVDLN